MNSLRKKFCLGGTCIVLLVILFAGCAKPTDGPSVDPTSDKKTWTVKFSGIPDDCAKGVVTVKAYDKNGDWVDSEVLGEITPSDTMSQSIEIDVDAVELDVLVSGNTSYDYQYFAVFDLSKVRGTELSNYYWIDYYQYVFNKRIWYGLNSADIVLSQTGKSIVGDFTDAPFYAYKIDNVKGKNIQLVIEGSTENVYFFDASDSTNLSSDKRSRIFNEGLACTASDGALYIMCAPADYSKAAKVNVRIVDQTDSVPSMKAHSFVPKDAVSIDGKTVYLYGENSKTLKKWVLATDTITEPYQFTDVIDHIAIDGDKILVAAGSKLYEYDLQTDTPVLKYTSSGIIRNFCIWGNDRIVAFEVSSPYLYSGSLVLLDRATQPYVTKGSAISGVDIPTREMLPVTGTTSDRIYFGNGSQKLYYINITSDAISSLAFASVTYNIGGVKRLGPVSAMTLVTDNGRVFSVSGITPAYTRTLSTGFNDILPLADKHLALVSGVDSDTSISYCYLMTYDLASPYAPLKRSGRIGYEIGVKFLNTPEGILMVSRQYQYVSMFGINYFPVHITKISDIDTVISQNFSLAGAKPSALNGKKPYSTLGLGAVVDANR